MAFNFASHKAAIRRTLQDTFGVEAFYTDASISIPVEFRCRWHSKDSKPFGGLYDGDGYGQVIEGVDRIVFIPVDVDGADFVPLKHGTVTLPTVLPGVTLNLELREPTNGVLEQSWQVTRA